MIPGAGALLRRTLVLVLLAGAAADLIAGAPWALGAWLGGGAGLCALALQVRAVARLPASPGRARRHAAFHSLLRTALRGAALGIALGWQPVSFPATVLGLLVAPGALALWAAAPAPPARG